MADCAAAAVVVGLVGGYERVSQSIMLWHAGGAVHRVLAVCGVLLYGYMIAGIAAYAADRSRSWRKNRMERNKNLKQRRPLTFLSTVESSQPPKLLPSGEQSLDQPEDRKRLQDGQHQEWS